MEFDVIIDCCLLDFEVDHFIDPADNKHLLSVVNDFEEGSWRYQKFENFVWDNIAETALSYLEREALVSQPFSLLRSAAQNLRLTDSDKDPSQGSELAEIVLYGLMKHRFNALPVVPKIFYKQNAQDTAKGADSVHIVTHADGTFSLWCGEAKFYNSIEDARLGSIVQSVRNSLDPEKLRKENSIVTSVSDIDHLDIDDELREKIRSALSNQASLDTIKPILNIPILVLHECEITAAQETMTSEYIEAIAANHKERAVAYFSKQLEQLADIHLYSQITFHLILFPVPEKEPIVEKFLIDVGHHKE